MASGAVDARFTVTNGSASGCSYKRAPRNSFATHTGLIIPHGIMPVHISKLLPLLGWYTGTLKSFQLEFTKAQLTVISNLSELHKAHVLHH